MRPGPPPPLGSGRPLLAGAVLLGLSGAALANQTFLDERLPVSSRDIWSVSLWGITALAGLIIVYLLNGKLPVRVRLETAIRISAPPVIAMCLAAYLVFQLGVSQVIFIPAMLLSVSPIALWLDARQRMVGWAVYVTLTGLAIGALVSPTMALWMLAIACVFLVAAASGAKPA